jgi:colicin import membrane protein
MTRTNNTAHWVIGALVLGVGATSGCNRSPSEAHNDAVEAQHEADQTAVNAKAEADKKIAEAQKDVQKASDDARKEAAEAQAKANEKIRDANRVIEGKTEGKTDDVRSWAQQKLDAVNNDIDTVKAKAQTAPPKAKEKFNAAIDEVQHQRDVLQTEVASLETRTGEELDKSKQQFSSNVDRVKDRIHKIEKSL